MKKIYLKLTALAITAAMLLAFSACGGEEPSADSTDPALVESAAVTPNETETPSDVEAESQAVPASGEEPATQNGGGTDTPSTSKSPVTDNQAALTLYNNAANSVKTDKPALHKERGTEFIGFDNPSNWLSELINKTGVIPKDDDLDFPAGTDYTNWFPPIGESWASKLTLNDLKSISCKDNGDTYTIEMTIKKSEIPTNLTDYSTTPVGRGMAINSTADLKAGAEAVGSLTGCDQVYDNCTITAVIDKATGKMRSATHILNFKIYLTGTLIISLDNFAVSLKITENYTMNY